MNLFFKSTAILGLTLLVGCGDSSTPAPTPALKPDPTPSIQSLIPDDAKIKAVGVNADHMTPFIKKAYGSIPQADIDTKNAQSAHAIKTLLSSRAGGKEILNKLKTYLKAAELKPEQLSAIPSPFSFMTFAMDFEMDEDIPEIDLVIAAAGKFNKRALLDACYTDLQAFDKKQPSDKKEFTLSNRTPDGFDITLTLSRAQLGSTPAEKKADPIVIPITIRILGDAIVFKAGDFIKDYDTVDADDDILTKIAKPGTANTSAVIISDIDDLLEDSLKDALPPTLASIQQLKKISFFAHEKQDGSAALMTVTIDLADKNSTQQIFGSLTMLQGMGLSMASSKPDPTPEAKLLSLLLSNLRIQPYNPDRNSVIIELTTTPELFKALYSLNQ